MHLKSIIDVCDPLVHWTGERYSSNNVYDEYENYALFNTNATLGEIGQDNHNYSDKSINLKNGSLSVLDGTFLQNELGTRDLSIHFMFKTTDPVVGLKPIISKWSPESVFFIGFENGTLMAKVLTASGIVQVSLNARENAIVYSGRWVHITFRITPTSISLHVNGKYNNNASIADPLESSTVSQFIIGGIGVDAFTTDFWINDIAITRFDNSYIPHVIYKLPRTDKELWLDLVPKYMFFIPESFRINPEAPIENAGTAGEVYGYLQTESTDPFYTVWSTGFVHHEYVHMPANSWFTIDDDLDLDFTGDYVTVIVDGDLPDGDINTSLNRFAFKYMDWQKDAGDTTNRLVWSDEQDQPNDNWTGFLINDTNDSLIYEYNNNNEDSGLYNDPGFKKFRIHHDGAQATCRPASGYWYNADTLTKTYTGYNPDEPMKWNRFWANDNTYGYTWGRIGNLAIFDREITESRNDILMYPRVLLLMHFMQNHDWQLAMQLYGVGEETSPQIQNYDQYVSSGMSQCTNNDAWESNISDGLGNRQNEMNTMLRLSTTDSYTGQNYAVDNNDVNTSDFSVSYFTLNLNTTARYEQLLYSVCPACSTDKGTQKFSVWMNSRDGEFSLGDVEIGYNNLATNFKISTTSKKFISTGWHMITVTRDGVDTKLYIDAICEAVLITPYTYNCGSTNTSWKLYGGDCYVSEFSFWQFNEIPREYVEFIFRGYSDIIKGTTLLDGSPISSTLLAARHDTGEVINTDYSGADGTFEFELSKNVNNSDVDIIALPQDSNATNHIVVHGPYNTNTVYSRFVNQVFDQTLKDMVLDMDPIAYYPMDDATGTTAVDATTTTGDGTYTGTVTYNNEGPDDESRSIFLDGTDGHVVLPSGFDDFTNGLTMEIWAHPTSTENHARFMEFATAVASVNGISFGRIGVTNDFEGVLTGIDEVNYNTGLYNNIWRHYVYRILPDFTQELWIDGILVSTFAGSAMPADISRTLNYIGKSTTVGDELFIGYLCHAATYDYVLPNEDLMKHFKRGHKLTMATYKSTVLDHAPSAYWTFDRTALLVDHIKEHTFTATGSYAIEKNALVINGGTIGNNYIQIPLADFHLNDESTDVWSIELMVKTDTINTDGIVIGEWDQDADAGTWKIQLDATDTFKFHMGSDVTYIQSATTYSDNVWHHLVVTYDGTTVLLYVDSVPEATADVSISNYGTYDLTIGNDETGDVSTHLEDRTEIDDVAFYNYVLDATRVSQHYEQFINKKGTL